MTKRYPGGYITKTAPTVSTTSAPGIWTMEQQAAYQKAGTWPFGGPFNYIEDVFSTYLYTGTGSDQTLTTGVDLSTYGGMIWSKRRSAVENHFLQDTNRGLASRISSNTTGAAATTGAWPMNAISTTGMTVSGVNYAAGGETYVSWTFRKQPKFFDVVTWTGNGTAGRTVAHNLGSVPGCIIIKAIDGSLQNWAVYHRSLGATQFMYLNSTGAASTSASYWNNTAPTDTNFTLGTTSDVNFNGLQYVAYLFAHNAGGFGSTNTDNVISCGSFTTDGSGNATVNLGYEPQWILIKPSSDVGNWRIADTMRGFSLTSTLELRPNQSSVEATFGDATFPFYPNATGFTAAGGVLGPSTTYIYIAIRRGPMKTPTSGTSVFSPQTFTGSGTGTTNFPVDLVMTSNRPGAAANSVTIDRLRGASSTANILYLSTSSTAAEVSDTGYGISLASNTSFVMSGLWAGSAAYWAFQRAPGFFDVVCYTGTGSARTVNHNLGVVPELMIVKRRNDVWDWMVYTATDGPSYYYWMNATNARRGPWTGWNNTTPTSSVFSLGTEDAVNASGSTYVAYLFASCPGVSKVGSYSGTGATQTISCGFAARFVLIKRTDDVGSWFVWDTVRGMVAGTDPRLALNSTAAETNANWVYTDAAGFQIVTTDATVNASGGSYIYLAIS